MSAQEAPGGAAAVCLGTPYRGDDAAGPLVEELLRADGVPVLSCDHEPTRLLDQWTGLGLVVIVDAVRSGAAAGTVHRIETRDEALPRDLGLASSHAFGVADALELAHTLGRAPARVVVYGIEGEAFGMGDPVTPAVRAAVATVAAAAAGELREALAQCTSSI